MAVEILGGELEANRVFSHMDAQGLEPLQVRIDEHHLGIEGVVVGRMIPPHILEDTLEGAPIILSPQVKRTQPLLDRREPHQGEGLVQLSIDLRPGLDLHPSPLLGARSDASNKGGNDAGSPLEEVPALDGIDEGALSGLHRAHHRDPKRLLVERCRHRLQTSAPICHLGRVVPEEGRQLTRQGLQDLPQLLQILLRVEIRLHRRYR
ncbi:MAG: hypothetical protein H6Q51_2469 [Deltaproteobacteria bacterium]|nr:hypothetical protein [Deltaproteobacteria bacterium]